MIQRLRRAPRDALCERRPADPHVAAPAGPRRARPRAACAGAGDPAHGRTRLRRRAPCTAAARSARRRRNASERRVTSVMERHTLSVKGWHPLSVVVAVLLVVLLPQPSLGSHSTLQLSRARSDLGAAAAGGVAVFGGGCARGSSGGGKTGGSCVSPSSAIDILRPSDQDAVAWTVDSSLSLSVGRGWPATCSFGPASDTVAFLGGGQPGASSVLDLLSVSTGVVRSNATALPDGHGRWGTSCAGSATQLIFAGGKLWDTKGPMMQSGVYALSAARAARGSPAIDGLALIGHLSEAREDCGAVTYGTTGALFAGGWVSWTEPGHPSVAVDSFDTGSAVVADAQVPANHFTWPRGLVSKPGPTQEWIGAVAYNESLIFLADATTLYEIGSPAVFSGKVPPRTRPLPDSVAASAGIPVSLDHLTRMAHVHLRVAIGLDLLSVMVHLGGAGATKRRAYPWRGVLLRKCSELYISVLVASK